jgi:hypothetical protein
MERCMDGWRDGKLDRWMDRWYTLYNIKIYVIKLII